MADSQDSVSVGNVSTEVKEKKVTAAKKSASKAVKDKPKSDTSEKGLRDKKSTDSEKKSVSSSKKTVGLTEKAASSAKKTAKSSTKKASAVEEGTSASSAISASLELGQEESKNSQKKASATKAATSKAKAAKSSAVKTGALKTEATKTKKTSSEAEKISKKAIKGSAAKTPKLDSEKENAKQESSSVDVSLDAGVNEKSVLETGAGDKSAVAKSSTSKSTTPKTSTQKLGAQKTTTGKATAKNKKIAQDEDVLAESILAVLTAGKNIVEQNLVEDKKSAALKDRATDVKDSKAAESSDGTPSPDTSGGSNTKNEKTKSKQGAKSKKTSSNKKSDTEKLAVDDNSSPSNSKEIPELHLHSHGNTELISAASIEEVISERQDKVAHVERQTQHREKLNFTGGLEKVSRDQGADARQDKERAEDGAKESEGAAALRHAESEMRVGHEPSAEESTSSRPQGASKRRRRSRKKSFQGQELHRSSQRDETLSLVDAASDTVSEAAVASSEVTAPLESKKADMLDAESSSASSLVESEKSFTEEGEGLSQERASGSGRRSRRSRGTVKGKHFTRADSQQAKASSSEEEEFLERDGDASGEKKNTQKKPLSEADAKNAKNIRRKMFVSVVPEEQIEVVLTEEGQVHEYYVEMLNQAKTKGNIYKAVIHNIDNNLQAAFVNYGSGKNGFLQIDEVHPEYYLEPVELGKNQKFPPIQQVLKPGQELLVQVVKEPAGTKGAFLTTYLSLAGRFLVLTPGREQVGVSRKVENDNERSRLRELLHGLEPGPGLGVIVRTASIGASKPELDADLAYLKESWQEIRLRGTEEEAPCKIHQELELAARAVRDYLTDNVVEVWIDDESSYTSVLDLVRVLFPKKKNLVKLHQESSSLFERFNLQRQLDQVHSREVSLPSGGRLVFDPTEALTAIDINSGRSNGKNNFEDMAFRTNMDAAKMIPLQLRLRDIGGQVVVDFIEMREKSHWREVEKTLIAGMRVDRARYDVGRISSFGMLEIVRQRLASSAISVSTEPCPHCRGTGVRRNLEWQSQQALREISKLIRSAKGQEKTSEVLVYEAEAELALHLLNSKRARLAEMEQSYGITLEIKIK